MSLRLSKPASRSWRTIVQAMSLVALTGCQGLHSTGSLARVRVISVSPNAPAVDVYQGVNAVAYNLSFGTVTSYLPVVPGTSAITVDMAGSHQVLSSVEGAFASDVHYTVLVGDPLSNAQPIVLTDRGPLAASRAQGTPMVRFVHQAMRTGAVDVYLVGAGHRLASATPIVTNLAVGVNTGYLAVPVCSCTVVMLPAGSPPSEAGVAVHNGAQSSYQVGSARTIILLDAPPSASSSVQVVTAMDAESIT